MSSKNTAHKAANAAFRDPDASQKPKLKDGRTKDRNVKVLGFDKAAPASIQLSRSSSSAQRPVHRDENAGNGIIREAEIRHKVKDGRPRGSEIRQIFSNPSVSTNISTTKTISHSPTKMRTKEDEKNEPISDDNTFNTADLFYVVMGVTGAGKSTLISLLSEDHVEVGHDLQSKTKHVSRHSFKCPDGRKIWLLDTPGFDDTERPNLEILKEIIASFTKLYELGGRISGVIYMHRITDPRMSGSALKSLEIFKLLIGSSAMPIVRLVSTRWNEVDLIGPDSDKAERLYEQLRKTDKFWGTMIEDGAIPIRHHGDRKSAIAIVSSLLKREEPPPKVAIVREILDEKLSLLNTATGRFISHDNEELRKQYESEIQKLQQERKQALEDKDTEVAELYATEEREYERRRANVLAAESQLNVNIERLHDQYQRSVTNGPSSAVEESPVDLKSENELLHLERMRLEEKIVTAERHHRIEVARLQHAVTQQNAQQRQEGAVAMNQLIEHYEHERRAMVRELRHLKGKNRKLRKSSVGFFEWLMSSE